MGGRRVADGEPEGGGEEGRGPRVEEALGSLPAAGSRQQAEDFTV